MKKRLSAIIILGLAAVLSSCSIFGKTIGITTIYSDAEKYTSGDFSCESEKSA